MAKQTAYEVAGLVNNVPDLKGLGVYAKAAMKKVDVTYIYGSRVNSYHCMSSTRAMTAAGFATTAEVLTSGFLHARAFAAGSLFGGPPTGVVTSVALAPKIAVSAKNAGDKVGGMFRKKEAIGYDSASQNEMNASAYYKLK